MQPETYLSIFILEMCIINFYDILHISHLTLIITFTYKLKSIAFGFSRLIFHCH